MLEADGGCAVAFPEVAMLLFREGSLQDGMKPVTPTVEAQPREERVARGGAERKTQVGGG